MSSTSGEYRTEGAGLYVRDELHGLYGGHQLVWVRLDAVYIVNPGTPRHVNGAGMSMTGEVPGVLTRWEPVVDGGWMGLVDYALPYADGRKPWQLRGQLLPRYALRPRGAEDPVTRLGGGEPGTKDT